MLSADLRIRLRYPACITATKNLLNKKELCHPVLLQSSPTAVSRFFFLQPVGSGLPGFDSDPPVGLHPLSPLNKVMGCPGFPLPQQQ